ncbi:Glyoxalase/Bleomycin resistance protein/Dioxygenase superfamily protein [Enhydrobacter aerosaccus]|uniref:Glyoxalase/Bleomycin resistance protein/Dioxygenase superfamily protein n=1 Tax=Enhydrobacter aerosaccus TaxID=225324 RepID=A0A1T4T3J2_9HYPH|nr:VOC family protein [Enhydrobacter aerosaccus]SKA35042.1 Glyoxalase/Bleomycin resistance protein/Dioxygenase superfamily protein [Enhydrobacter aerosaccus]
MSGIEGIDRITYGVEDVGACRHFFLDWGLRLVAEHADGLDFESLNGCEVFIRKIDDPSLPPAMEAGPTLREVIWGVDDPSRLGALRRRPGFREIDGTIIGVDPTGVGIGFRMTHKRPVSVTGSPANVWGRAARIDQPSPIYERAEPVEVGHVVFFTDALDRTTQFYEELGFHLSDRYPGRGHFLRCAARGGHHDLFLLQLPEAKRGLNHVAFTVRDLHEVIGGGMHLSRCGWETQIGPGRHPISSALFWYFKCPAGALVEYFADEDILTEHWKPRDFQPSPSVFAEWAVDGGIDGNTRRQKQE